jgi:hypothetical protein
MSVMTPGKPDGLTRAAAPARRRAGSADRGQTAGVPRQRRRAQGRPGAGAVRHLRAVPDPSRQRTALAVPDAAPAPDARGPRNASRAGAAPGPRHGAAVRRRGMPARDARMASRRSTVRLTRRGRIVVATLLTALCLLLVALAWMAVAARAQAADGGLPRGAVYRNLTSVVVHPGQTLWSIASQAEPSADPRVVMQLIVELNALHGTGIEPGQHLWVPHG